MLRRVVVPQRSFPHAAPWLASDLRRDVLDLAHGLRGRRILQINSTAKGGGVAEILRATTPLLQDLGLRTEWHVLTPEDGFWRITKNIHDALQGAPDPIPDEDWQIFESVSRSAATELDAGAWDLIVVHDPQPSALRKFADRPERSRWLWRCHIDSSHPEPGVRSRMLDYVRLYDASIFTLPDYALDGYEASPRFVLPAIDPESAKNGPLDGAQARALLRTVGLDLARPFIVQVSRFDRWKDPFGVLEAFRIAKRSVPDLQLVLAGETAHDDHTALATLDRVRHAAEGIRDVHILADAADDQTVNALQSHALVVLQKSLREGFGLTVSEALWSGRPVIGGAVGGIPQQIRQGHNGFLVNSVEDAARRIVELARDPALADRMGEAGRRLVQQNFLLPRLMRDELRIWTQLVEVAPTLRGGR